ncbi:plasmid pRiA4b ORF-3 family protein [Hymenobacter rubripertinctus]|uniref:Plasmid pRiA4b ORF-3 family protein n=1 Tax=Hymenobacter rubripertinctus TaxID=2029981 RepID=A0A418QXW5_9BACT|nr:plasmid pRiA4b ORF-3 family protein [Hymenobacter rubripertinctus]RIY09979.1 plasmid pRiA4b ORF-3 family protein [Hymenobacter rubripertinctus]
MANLLTLKVSMRYTQPSIWRRVEVPDTLTFWELHFVLQIVFDWENYHLFEFRQGRGSFRAGSPSLGSEGSVWEDEPPQQDPREVPLSAVLRVPADKVTYTYDFGDSWEHDIVVEQITPLAADSLAPAVRCLDGRRAAPLEDMGGIPGYEQLLDLLAEKAAGKRKRMPSEFAGLGKFDPNEFDLKGYNYSLIFLTEIVADFNQLMAARQ